MCWDTIATVVLPWIIIVSLLTILTVSIFDLKSMNREVNMMIKLVRDFAVSFFASVAVTVAVAAKSFRC